MCLCELYMFTCIFQEGLPDFYGRIKANPRSMNVAFQVFYDTLYCIEHHSKVWSVFYSRKSPVFSSMLLP